MRVRQLEVIQQLLQVDDNFATLIDVEPNGNFVYEFRYRASVVEALRLGASQVRITVHSTAPQPEVPTIRILDRPSPTRGVIADILTLSARQKDAGREDLSTVIGSRNSDLTAGLNNELVGLIGRADVPPESILGKERVIDVRPLSEMTSQNFDPPIMQTSAMAQQDATQAQQDPQRAFFGLLGRRIDPSSLGERAACITTTFAASSGIQKSATAPPIVSSQPLGISNRTDAMRRDIALSYIGVSQVGIDPQFDLPEAALVPVVAEVARRTIVRDEVMRVPEDQVGFNDFYVQFELVDPLGRSQERITKRVNHALLIRIFNTPTAGPRIRIAPFQFPGKNVLELEQVDRRAERVRIERRHMKRSEIDQLQNTYQLVAEVPLRRDAGIVKFIDIVNNFSSIQYRAIAVGPGGIIGGNAFGNAVSPAVQKGEVEVSRRLNAASLEVRNVVGGVSIGVMKVSPGVIAVGVTRRDLTLHDTDVQLLNIEDPVRLVTNGLARARFLDDDVDNEHIYEYGCLLYYDDGVILAASAAVVHRHIDVAVGAVTVDVSDPRIIRSGGTIDVQFTVTSELAEGNLDVVRAALDRQGMTDLFQTQLEQERDKLEKLIAHSVERINLTTGEHEAFGTFSGSEFSDRIQGARNAVKPLQEGHRYRYVIMTLLREAESMFDDYRRSALDQSTGKTYSYSPAKYRHPVTLSRGILVDRQSLLTHHPEDDFSFGRAGNPREVDVDISVSIPRIRDISVARVDRRNVNLRWGVDGVPDHVEHFVVLKEVLGMTSIAGRVHHVSNTGMFEFFDRVTPEDIGEVSYRVVPILNDFTKGATSSTATLAIRDGRIG